MTNRRKLSGWSGHGRTLSIITKLEQYIAVTSNSLAGPAVSLVRAVCHTAGAALAAPIIVRHLFITVGCDGCRINIMYLAAPIFFPFLRPCMSGYFFITEFDIT